MTETLDIHRVWMDVRQLEESVRLCGDVLGGYIQDLYATKPSSLPTVTVAAPVDFKQISVSAFNSKSMPSAKGGVVPCVPGYPCDGSKVADLTDLMGRLEAAAAQVCKEVREIAGKIDQGMDVRFSATTLEASEIPDALGSTPAPPEGMSEAKSEA